MEYSLIIVCLKYIVPKVMLTLVNNFIYLYILSEQTWFKNLYKFIDFTCVFDDMTANAEIKKREIAAIES